MKPESCHGCLIEVQNGSYFGEDDIIRYEDVYCTRIGGGCGWPKGVEASAKTPPLCAEPLQSSVVESAAGQDAVGPPLASAAG